MILKLSDTDLNKLDELFNIDECNKVFADFLFDYIDNAKVIAKKYRTSLYESIIKHFEVSKDVLDYFKDNNLKDNIVKLDISKYENNPYNKNIVLNNVTDGLYKFEYHSFLPHEGFLCEDIKVDDKFVEHTKIGYFDKEYKYLTLSYDNNIWMLITPHEINTMNDAINKASGDVITFGLGLGYFPYMCSLKDDVSSVTIIEKDENIINLFKKHILPLFEHKEKIIIINDDAINYSKNNIFKYNYGFVDLWRDTNDGLKLYIDMKNANALHLSTTFDYWIEDSMLQIIRRAMIAMLFETVNQINIETEETYFDYVVNRLKKIYEKVEIYAFDQIEKILSDDTIRYLSQMI